MFPCFMSVYEQQSHSPLRRPPPPTLHSLSFTQPKRIGFVMLNIVKRAGGVAEERCWDGAVRFGEAQNVCITLTVYTVNIASCDGKQQKHEQPFSENKKKGVRSFYSPGPLTSTLLNSRLHTTTCEPPPIQHRNQNTK